MSRSAQSSDPSASLAYDGYERWKGWDEFMQLSAYDRAYFAAECKGMVVDGGKILEIGFGAGKFLAFAKDQGAQITATEMNEVLQARAKDNGIAIIGPDFSAIVENAQAEFDSIFAFDVFEHLPPEGLAEGLDCLVACLKPGGRALLRFPNGQSPFGLAPQHGDHTHRLALSKSYLEGVMHDRPLEIIRYGGSARVAVGGIVQRAAQYTRFFLRNVIEGALKRVYGSSVPYDPVVTLVLQRK